MTSHNRHPHEDARMIIDLPFEEHKRLKAIADIMGLSIKDLILKCLRENLLNEDEPNNNTLKAFKKTDERKGIISCRDFNEFIDKLEC